MLVHLISPFARGWNPHPSGLSAPLHFFHRPNSNNSSSMLCCFQGTRNGTSCRSASRYLHAEPCSVFPLSDGFRNHPGVWGTVCREEDDRDQPVPGPFRSRFPSGRTGVLSSSGVAVIQRGYAEPQSRMRCGAGAQRFCLPHCGQAARPAAEVRLGLAD
jgi:hypothetical protein